MGRFGYGVFAAVFGIVLATACLPQPSAAASDPNVTAVAGVLMDVTTGKVLWARNPDLRRPPASTTKILTAILALENGDLKKTAHVTKEAAETEGSSMWLSAGEKLTVSDLLYGVMLNSGNDACVVVAEAVSGNVNRFVDLMNKKAKEIGALHSHFANPNGLPDPNHYSTAKDLALITRYGLNNQSFAHLVKTREKEVAPTLKGKERFMRNHNKLLWQYDGADGVKTGYTIEAGKCLVASATRDGQQLISVVLGSKSIWGDAKELLDYGFSNYCLVKGPNKGDLAKTVAGIGNGDGTPLKALVARDIVALVNRSQKESLVKMVKVDGAKAAPVKKGASIGRIELRDVEGQVVAQSALIAGNDVPLKPPAPKGIWRLFVSALRWFT